MFYLFRGGRFYTLLLALYDDLHSRAGIDPSLLVERGSLALNDRGRVVLSPDVPPAWETHTSALLLQLAYAEHRRNRKGSHP